MPAKKHIQPGEKLPLKLTPSERKLILEGLMCLDEEIDKVVREAPTGQPVLLPLDDLDDLIGHVAAEANHCSDKRKQRTLDAVYAKIQRLLDKFTDADPPQRINVDDARSPRGNSTTGTGAIYQFKITLLGINPPIWRRIQVSDCTLDKLHEHIQTAMGWTNSHLHQFDIKGRCYGDPGLLEDNFEEFDCGDSTQTMVSEILPKSVKRFAFKYEYDFGDGWEHEILFEGCPPADKSAKYPVCLEGERACPPEDVGGVGGYQDFLTAIADPMHKDHKNLRQWCGRKFSPDEFDSGKTTRDMRKGLPDWRRM